MMKNLPFIVLLMFAISMPPRSARAVEPATVAAVAALTSSVVSFFDSGTSVTAAEVSQIRKMIETLHKRLENYDAALLGVMNKLDDMPEIMRTELQQALDRNQGHALLAAIELIVEDVRIMEKNRQMPLADPLRRLDKLQQASRNMMQRNDLNLPYIIAALRTERAFIQAIGVSEPSRTADWEGRKETYLRRFERVFQDDRDTPMLIKKANALQEHISDWMQPSRDELRKVKHKVAKSEERIELTPGEFRWLQEKHRPLYMYCRHIPPVFRYRIIHTNDAARELATEKSEEVKRKEANRTIIQEELLLLYRYMIDYARYSHTLLSGGEARPPKKPVERSRPYIEALKGFAKEVQEYADNFPRQQEVERSDGSPSGCRHCMTINCADQMLSPHLLR